MDTKGLIFAPQFSTILLAVSQKKIKLRKILPLDEALNVNPTQRTKAEN